MACRTTGRVSENVYTFTADASDNKARFRCEASNVISPSPLKTEVELSVLCKYLIFRSSVSQMSSASSSSSSCSPSCQGVCRSLPASPFRIIFASCAVICHYVIFLTPVHIFWQRYPRSSRLLALFFHVTTQADERQVDASSDASTTHETGPIV